MSLALLSDEISMVYAPLAVPVGTLNVAEPVLAMPAVENLSVLCSSERKTMCRGTHKPPQSLGSNCWKDHCAMSKSPCQMS